MISSTLKWLVCCGIAWVSLPALAWDGDTDEPAWTQLTNDVAAGKAQLEDLMAQAAVAGVDTNYAYVSKVVIDRFQTYAQYDRSNPDEVYEAFTNVWWHAKVPDQNYSVNLPFDEMQSCLEVSSNAIAELQAQLATNVVLKAPVDFTTGAMSFGPGSALRNGEPVFPSDFTWMPGDEDLMTAFGRMGGTYYALTDMSDDTTVKANAINNDVNSMTDQNADNIAFGQYFIGHKAASWMTNAHPEIVDGGRNFVTYDTDSPYIRGWFTNLFQGYLPPVCEEQGDQPRMHLLANEPNFATRTGGWLADNGVSANTMTNYNGWLTEKYTTISNLNSTYGTSYADFNAAMNGMSMPIDPTAAGTVQGGPVWYDWCRFNMDRVNDFFQFLKDGTQGSDPLSKPVTIKILGGQLGNSWRDDGMDMEYLANLMDVTGADLHVIPANATIMQPNKIDTTWTNHYTLDWREQSMMLDFYKSLYPDKPYYDSEWHGFATGKWRDFSMDRDYVRSALWLGFTHGMNCIQSWVWARENDGNFLNVNSDFIGDILTQPTALDAYGRVMKELNAHATDVTGLVKQDRHFMVYYCGEAAIQNLAYVEELEEVYEALKLLNVRVGFTTPSDISGLSVSSQTVVVPPTTFISDASYVALLAFEQAGGNVVLVNGSTASFLKTELGFAASDNTNLAPYASVDFDVATVMVNDLGDALDPLMLSNAVHVVITDSGAQPAYGILATQTVDPVTGESTLSLINVSKDARTVSLSLSSGYSADYRDLLIGQLVSSIQTMEPYDVLLLKTENQSVPPVVSVAVQWGEAGGDTNIVAGNQDFVVKNTTYIEGTAANPAVGSSYYPINTDRSAVFNTSSSSSGNAKQVLNTTYGDTIRSGKNQATYDCMYVWENLSAGNVALAGLAAETRVAMWGGTGTGVVHWIIQKETGDWYASAGTELTKYNANSASFNSLSVPDASVLNWSGFTPITSGYGTIGSSASIDMKNIKSVGLYYDLSGSGENINADLRYFKATVISGTPASGWDDFVALYGLSPTGVETNDFDKDGELDYVEYALGGNPTNPASQGVPPSMAYNPDHYVSFFNLELIHSNPGITYIQEWTDNLISNVWNSSWDWSTNNSSDTSGYDEVEHKVYGGTNANFFFRLKVLHP